MASSKYEYYKHRPNRSNAWLWWIAVSSLMIGALIYFGLSADEVSLETDRMQRMVLAVSISVSAICAVLATSYRWFYH